ncbi:hypothetical protein EST38_g10358 [Candolleomyces aberdarensis]|uniref:Uncharacterized protein n=1 Tax=Candolleomyces aberdarensis TaxID=2316362 RepID=A0A4Q2DAT9_9AGAR|nr:hypothetical protein EST38_g10358 [Candolleomyces aberdarensis]
MANVDFSRVHAAPGLGQPLEYVPAHGDPLYIRGPIENALDKEQLCGLGLIPLRELAMVRFINLITDKQEWHKKVFDDSIVAKWRAEVKSSGEDFTEKMFEYCIQELRYRAERFEPTGSERGAIVVFNGKVVKSDYAVSECVKLALQNAIKRLERVPEVQKDWHPGSDGKVLDLVHPSLYPLVYGKTKVLPVGSQATTFADCISRCGEGTVIPTPIRAQPEDTRPYYDYMPRNTYDPYSTKFQWLPCEVDISGDRPKILSYINNLHPEKHKDLYHSIESIIEAAIPLWEISIAEINPEDRYSAGSSFWRISYPRVEYAPNFESIPESDFPSRLSGEEDNPYYWRKIQWWENHRTLVIPEPTLPFDSEGFKLSNSDTSTLKEVYAKHRRPLQIIVKVANIELTPEKPVYGGGTWHVEGKLNEHICATAIYYHSCSNITESSLGFRQVISDGDPEEMEYEQNDHAWLQTIFGCAQDEEKLQVLGAVKTLEGRLITFPNILHHRVGRFKLADRTKPGHRKIVALFLVDPNVRVISTASVPCQQLEWWKEANIAQSAQRPASSRSLLERLPVEVQDQVFGHVQDFPISSEEAKELRLELMEERKTFVLANAQMLEGRTISLCEH